MTAAHVTAMTVDCPNCQQPAGHICTAESGYRKSIPCIARTKRAGTFETSPQTPTAR